MSARRRLMDHVRAENLVRRGFKGGKSFKQLDNSTRRRIRELLVERAVRAVEALDRIPDDPTAARAWRAQVSRVFAAVVEEPK